MNANSDRHRTLDESKNKMKNIKKKLRSASSSHRMALLKTGGGQPPAPLSFGNEHEMALYQYIAVSAEGLPPVMDSEFETGDDGRSCDNADDKDYQPESDETIFNLDSYDCTVLESPTPPSTSTTVTTITLTTSTSTSTSPASKATADWSKYTPQLLRTPRSKALVTKKPSSENIAELREIQINQSFAMEKEKHDFEMQEARKRAERAEKEHTLRRKLMEAELLSKYGPTYHDDDDDSELENNSE